MVSFCCLDFVCLICFCLVCYYIIATNNYTIKQTGGPRRLMTPQVTVTIRQRFRAYKRKPLFKTTAKSTAAATSIGSVRNWHSTHSCMCFVICVRCPPQWWCTHSVQDASAFSEDSWMCNDDSTSIGRNTANKTYADICLRIVTFMTAKLQQFISNPIRNLLKLLKVWRI